jgi:hypothetical protein
MATEVEIKAKERKELLDEIKRKRAIAAQSEGILGAAERGEYGDVGQGGEKGPFDDEIIQDIMEYQAGDVSQLDLTKAQRQFQMPKSSIDKFMRRGLGFLFRKSPVGLALTYGPEVAKSIKNLVMPADQMVTDTGAILNMADDAKRFPIQMGGPEKKLIKGVNDTAEDIFDEIDQNIIDEIDIVSGFKDANKTPSYATPEKKKLTLKLLKIAENDKSNEAFGVKFQNAYKNYVLGEDAAIPKDYFRGGFQSYKKAAKNILSYKNQDPNILNISNPTTVRVSADGTKVTQLVGNTAGDPQTLWNKIKVNQPITGDAKKRLRSEIIVGDETKNFRAVKYEITQKDKIVSSKLSKLKNLFEESTDNTHIYSIDHIQAPRFGGANANKENLTFIMEGPHNNLKNLPTSKTLADDVVKPKSRFEDEVYKKATGLVDAVANKNTIRAKELSKEIFDLQNNFKSTFKNVDFVVGEAFVPIKTGEKTANYVKYSDQVGLNDEQKKLVEKLLPTYSNRPNKGVSVEKSIDKLIDAYSQMAILTPGGKLSKGAAGQMYGYGKKDGGMMNINDITGPLGKFSSQI